MAKAAAKWFGDRDVTALFSSPLQRALETAAPLADALDLPVTVDDRLIEADNHFEGLTFGAGSSLRRPEHWRHLLNPFKPSWGEPYLELAARMRAAVIRAREAARGHEAVCVSHQLPIWILRLHAERRRSCGTTRKRVRPRQPDEPDVQGQLGWWRWPTASPPPGSRRDPVSPVPDRTATLCTTSCSSRRGR